MPREYMKDINATVIVDLKPDKEEIFSYLQKDARWGIKKAEKEGLSIEETNDIENWKRFYEIYRKEFDDRGIEAETFEHVKEHGNVLLICKKDNKIIAGATLGLKDGLNNSPKLTRNASVEDYQKFQPNNILYWHCILWSKEHNYKSIDLGGWQINAKGQMDGVNKFKERWGKITYYHKEYPFLKAIGRKLVRNFRFLWWLNKKLKRRN